MRWIDAEVLVRATWDARSRAAPETRLEAQEIS
jgi:hypothetical protein